MAIWRIWPGPNGMFEVPAMRHGITIVDWEVPDLSGMRDRAEVREFLEELWEDAPAGRITNRSAQLAKFRFDVQLDDLVLMPQAYPAPWTSGLVTMGRVTGPYVYREVEELGRSYHTRTVDWFCIDVPRGRFREGFAGALDFGGTLCQVH